MSPWSKSQKVTPPVPEDSVYYVSAAAVIHASREQIWNFIKPPENIVLVSPNVVRGFRAPGKEGVGEIQVFISDHEGMEHVSAIEVTEEIPLVLAITRTLGDEDPAARGRTSLRDSDRGTTVLEHGQYFTMPPEAAGYFHQFEQHHRLHCRQYVERVKAFLEQSHPAAADARDVGQPDPPKS